MFHEVLCGHSPKSSLLVTRYISSPERTSQPLQASLQGGHFTHRLLLAQTENVRAALQ